MNSKYSRDELRAMARQVLASTFNQYARLMSQLRISTGLHPMVIESKIRELAL